MRRCWRVRLGAPASERWPRQLSKRGRRTTRVYHVRMPEHDPPNPVRPEERNRGLHVRTVCRIPTTIGYSEASTVRRPVQTDPMRTRAVRGQSGGMSPPTRASSCHNDDRDVELSTQHGWDMRLAGIGTALSQSDPEWRTGKRTSGNRASSWIASVSLRRLHTLAHGRARAGQAGSGLRIGGGPPADSET